MSYSRLNPSQRYNNLLDQYREMHTEGEKFIGIPAENTFPGLSLPPQAQRIKRLIKLTESANLLDYGSGKGKQYDPMPFKAGDQDIYDSILDYWDIDSVHCYDPCYTPFSRLPENKFDGVISTDVLEHCPEEDLPWIIEEMFSFSRKFLFANVACYPAKKRLPNGQNAHITIKSESWWQDIFHKISTNFPGIVWEVWIQTLTDTNHGKSMVETCLTNQNTDH
ncbi:class I SAM-dependent methyltransferase [Methylocaldum sp.]|uniref:class I SAM-dependent methyltransferase n=1 Tax=Methylocaldum sp. TaxID=1969727 RepID=UPI002D574F0F|nr:class I SAM-dependent methyltransferase [Methylocaldum sp.]HYE36628.1 class I SAM-dependent methyltransferase [Methylocaldum sp.]